MTMIRLGVLHPTGTSTDARSSGWIAFRPSRRRVVGADVVLPEPFSVMLDPSGSRVQVVTITGSPTGGTFTLAIGGVVTSALAFNAAAATVQAAIRALGTPWAAATASGSAGGPYTITLSVLGGASALIIADGALLTGGTPAFDVSVAADLAPTGVDWCWEASEHVSGSPGSWRSLAVPDSVTTVDYAALVEVDPATLDPIAEPTAAWWVGAADTAAAAAAAEVARAASVVAQDAAVVSQGAAADSAAEAVETLASKLDVTAASATYTRADDARIVGLTDVDVNEAWAQAAAAPLSITTYVGGTNELVHPSVIYFPKQWNGYHYWMAFTPFNGGDGLYENPSIVASQDGTTWVTPAGITNPIVFSANGYNPDPCLVQDPDGVTVHMVWQQSWGGTDILWVRSSTDAITWSTQVKMVETVLTVMRDVSPALRWNPDIGKWMMWTTSFLPSPNVVQVRTADTITGTWSAPTVLNVTGPVAGCDLWHIDVQETGGMYFMLIHSGTDGQGNPGNYSLAKSRDGYTWTSATTTLMTPWVGWARTKYKAAMLPQIGPKGLEFRLWYTSGTGSALWLVGESVIRFDRTRRISDRANAFAQTALGVNGAAMCDTFNRADTTAGLGNSSSGHTWTAAVGTMGIASRKAYATTDANAMVTYNAGAANFTATVQLDAYTVSAWLVFRWQDASNFWRLGVSGNYYTLQKVISGSGVVTVIAGSTTTAVWSAGMWLTVKTSGSTIIIYANDEEIGRVTDTALAAATVVGIQSQTMATRFSKFMVTVP